MKCTELSGCCYVQVRRLDLNEDRAGRQAAKAEVRTPGILSLAEIAVAFSRSQSCND